MSDSEEDPRTDGEFVEAPEPSEPRSPRDFSPTHRVTNAVEWLGQSRRSLAIALGVIVVVAALLAYFGFVGLMTAALAGWYLLLGGSILVALVRWLAHKSSRDQGITFVRDNWRELVLAAAVSFVIGEIARADEVIPALVIAGFAFLLVLSGIGSLEERTRFGQWLHQRRPQAFLAVAALLLLLGPQFRREMTTDYCDDPNYWVETDFQENDYGGGTSTYGCFSPELDDIVAPRVEGRSLYGLRFSNVGMRIYSLNFTGGQFEGVGVCLNDEDCFP